MKCLRRINNRISNRRLQRSKIKIFQLFDYFRESLLFSTKVMPPVISRLSLEYIIYDSNLRYEQLNPVRFNNKTIISSLTSGREKKTDYREYHPEGEIMQRRIRLIRFDIRARGEVLQRWERENRGVRWLGRTSRNRISKENASSPPQQRSLSVA